MTFSEYTLENAPILRGGQSVQNAQRRCTWLALRGTSRDVISAPSNVHGANTSRRPW